MAARAGPPAAAPAASAEDLALVERLEAALATRPDDLEGHRLLARSLAGARPLAGGAGGAGAGGGDPRRRRHRRATSSTSPRCGSSPPAAMSRRRPRRRWRAALALDPGDPAGRYYSALTLLQGGRPDLAYRIWSGLVAEGPPDAPWIAPARGRAGRGGADGGPAAAGAGPARGRPPPTSPPRRRCRPRTGRR